MKHRIISIIMATLFVFASLAFADDTVTTSCPDCPPMVEPPVIDVPQTPVVTIDTITINTGVAVFSNPFQDQSFAYIAPCDLALGNMFQDVSVAGETGPYGAGTALGSETQFMKRTLTVAYGIDFFTGAQSDTVYGEVSPTSSPLDLTGQQNIDGSSQTEYNAVTFPCGSSFSSAAGNNELGATAVLKGYGQNIYADMQQQAVNGYSRVYGDTSSNNYSTMNGLSNVTTTLNFGSAPGPQD